jgi:hypothetical protein
MDGGLAAATLSVSSSFVEQAGIDFHGSEIDKALAAQEIEHGLAFFHH